MSRCYGGTRESDAYSTDLMQYIPLGIKDTVLFEHLRHDGYCRVDRIRDDQDKCVGGILSDPCCKIANNPSIDLLCTRKISTYHAGVPEPIVLTLKRSSLTSKLRSIYPKESE
jgi:hypothetical protein